MKQVDAHRSGFEKEVCMWMMRMMMRMMKQGHAVQVRQDFLISSPCESRILSKLHHPTYMNQGREMATHTQRKDIDIIDGLRARDGCAHPEKMTLILLTA